MEDQLRPHIFHERGKLCRVHDAVVE